MAMEEESPVLIRRLPEEDLSVREIRISCPDATGLGADVARMLLDFGLSCLDADISTDGSWCFLILKVKLTSGVPPRWALLRERLEQIIPTGAEAIRSLWNNWNSLPKEQPPFLVKVSGYDRQGMLHALSQVLWEANTTVFKAHIVTQPDGHVDDTFWLYDNKDELPEPHRVLEICDRVKGAVGAEAECIINPAPEESVPRKRCRMACKDARSKSSLRLAAVAAHANKTRRAGSIELNNMETPFQLLNQNQKQLLQVVVEVDNETAASSTLLTLRCPDRKGLLYDVFRTFKEVSLKVAYMRLHSNCQDADASTTCEAEIFVQDTDGYKITDPLHLEELIERVKAAAVLPVKVEISDTSDGTATELTVSTDLDVGGRGRPRVTFDVTQGLCSFGVGIDTADVYIDEGDSGTDTNDDPCSPQGSGGGSIHSSHTGHETNNSSNPIEKHRFRIHTADGKPLATEGQKKAMHDVVCAALMGLSSPTQSTELLSGTSSSLHRQHTGEYNNDDDDSMLLMRSLSSKWKGNNSKTSTTTTRVF